MLSSEIGEILRNSKPEHQAGTDPNDCREAWMVWAIMVDKFVNQLSKNDPNFNRMSFYQLVGAI